MTPEDAFVSDGQRTEALTLGLWIFLATEVLFFGGLLVIYTAYRIWYPHDFAAGSRHLDFALGTLNTAILLTSSFFMAGAVTASENRQRRSAVVLMLLTAACGCVFLLIKGSEWYTAIHDGFWPGQGSSAQPPGVHLFFSLYFALTGLHGLHMMIGLALLGLAAWSLRKEQGILSQPKSLKLLGLYWHFIDIVWIFLYPLLYFIGRSS